MIEINDEFGYWFSGYVDGEGCFTAGKQKGARKDRMAVTRFYISCRKDDRGVLEHIQRNLGIGVIRDRVTSSKGLTRKPWCSYEVTARKDIISVLIPLFNRYLLHSKKKIEFEVWSTITLLMQEGHRNGHASVLSSESTALIDRGIEFLSASKRMIE
jgi:hypothetical protein